MISKAGLLTKTAVRCFLLIIWLYAVGLAYAQTEAKDTEQVRGLIGKLDSPDANERRAAMDELTKIGEPAVPSIIETMKTASRSFRRKAAIEALGAMGPVAKEAVPALIDLLGAGYRVDRPDSVLIESITVALGNIGAEAAPAVPALIQLLHAERFIQEHAAEALGNIGPPAHDAIVPLRELYKNDEAWRNGPVEEALCKIQTREVQVPHELLRACEKIPSGPESA